MSIRWRKDGQFICGAKSKPMVDDVYIDDNLHYELAVLDRILKPFPSEKTCGRWYIVSVKNKRHKNVTKLLALKQNNICGICNKKLNGQINLDHIDPVSKTGCHTIDNLQAVHKKCNLRKGNKTVNNSTTN